MRGAVFTVRCSDPQRRQHPAKYKIAAQWNGGGYSELKTYGFADDECLEQVYRLALQRIEQFLPAEGETLSPLHIYQLDPRRPDRELQRRTDLEDRLRAPNAAE